MLHLATSTGINAVRMLTVVTGLAAAMVSAQGKPATGPLMVNLAHQKVAMQQGKEVLIDAGAAKPGEVIEYRATYENTSKKPLLRVLATLPVPLGTEVLPSSLNPGAAQASLDGATFKPVPLKRKVKRDGKEIEELVPYAEYRFLRWDVGTLAPGKKAMYVARVKVATDGRLVLPRPASPRANP